MANMTCQGCGTLWQSTDTGANYFFASDGGTYSRGDYASPSLINAEAEDISYCPACTQVPPGPLKRVTELMGGGETQIKTREGWPAERVSKGSADVIHPPSLVVYLVLEGGRYGFTMNPSEATAAIVYDSVAGRLTIQDSIPPGAKLLYENDRLSIVEAPSV